MRKILVVLGILLFGVIFNIVIADDYGGGIYQIETLAVVDAPYNFFVKGPALQTLMRVGAVAIGSDGEIFFTNGDKADIFVYKDGIVHNFAGSHNQRGYRDGPAEFALFDPGGRGYKYQDIAFDKTTGCLYYTDGRNERIRKICKDTNGQWMVSTSAGGGDTRLVNEGDSADALDVDLGNIVSVTVDSEGNVYTSPLQKLVKITPDGQATLVLVFPDDGYPTFRDVVDLEIDDNDNIYGVVRGGMYGYFKYTKDGQFVRLTFLEFNDENATWDGPIETASFYGPSKVGVNKDGSEIYCGGGDETCLRRIKDGRVSTLQENGTWQEDYKRNKAWLLGSVRTVDENGAIYLADTQYRGVPLRKLTKIS